MKKYTKETTTISISSGTNNVIANCEYFILEKDSPRQHDSCYQTIASIYIDDYQSNKISDNFIAEKSTNSIINECSMIVPSVPESECETKNNNKPNVVEYKKESRGHQQEKNKNKIINKPKLKNGEKNWLSLMKRGKPFMPLQFCKLPNMIHELKYEFIPGKEKKPVRNKM